MYLNGIVSQIMHQYFFCIETVHNKNHQHVNQSQDKKIKLVYDDAKATTYKDLLQQNINCFHDKIASSENRHKGGNFYTIFT